MFYDLNVPFEPSSSPQTGNAREKANIASWISPEDQAKLDARLDILIHLGYTIIALNQTITGVFNPKSHRNILQGIRPREGIVILRRLTIILTEESEKGSGLVASNTDALKAYDLIALCPTTPTTFQQACLTYSVASPLTAHVITFDLQANQRLPFFMKMSLVRTAMKNGAVFEIRYCTTIKRNSAERSRRNWWINAKEVVRATGGKGLVFTGGGLDSEVRAPKDVENLAILLGCKQDQAHHSMTSTVKSLLLRAQTRQTYRAVLSEPQIVAAKSLPIPRPAVPPAKKRPLTENEDDEDDCDTASKTEKRRKKKKKGAK
ncbi:hypothetical protein FRB94_002850 [Tulasnella sp. JGI-2019a]|nr:hypothetical protein FRB93_011317 [Tulasnella sp. JGI-2019a]KAG9003859.1 hypothetical protein FRB94_002850 [Tulasnella sp. JGI-2019a]KAG9036883.1 hypothetical protein FRB95_007728 [Tulasnella sp. JGI-2019a]